MTAAGEGREKKLLTSGEKGSILSNEKFIINL